MNKTMHEARRYSRRRFLETSAGVAGITILPRYVIGGRGYLAPSDRINIALIGAGSQGIGDMKGLLQEPDTQIVAIADPSRETKPRGERRSAGRTGALRVIEEMYEAERPGEKPKPSAQYSDFRQMFDKEKGIDAVLVATPDHTHAIAVMAAIRAGKHVFCEKPLCHKISEVRKITEASREAKIATQMGNQGHSGEGIRLTCEWIWDGAIGSVREVHGWAKSSYYRAPGTRPVETPPVPEGLDWDLWIGPAVYRPYHPFYHPGVWRFWHEFGTGVLGDFACHHLDPAFWALKLVHPTSVQARRDTPGKDSFPKASIVTFEFPERGTMPPVKLYWYDGGLMPERPAELEKGREFPGDGHGILFIGDKGKIVCPGWGGTPRIIPETAMREYRRPPRSLPRSKGHQRDWLDACKGGPMPSANFEAVSPMVESILMGVIAVITGQRLEWDGPGMRCTNYPPANDWVTPIYRSGWTL